MSKKTETFVMPGAEPDDLDLEENKKLDLSFMEPSDEEKAELEAAAERKAAREQEIADEKEAEAAKVAAKKQEEEDAEKERLAAEAAKNKDKKDDDLTEEEKAEAAKIEAERAEKDKGKKQPMVPKTRLDEVLEKNKVLKAELDAERAAKASRTPEKKSDEVAVDLDAKEAEYMEAVMAGEKDKALKIRKEIRAEEAKAFAKQADDYSSHDSEAVALAKAAKSIEENFPQFVKGHEKFNEEATARVIKMRDGLIASGSNAVEALNEAVEFVVNKYGFNEDIEPKKDDKVVDLAEKRKADAVKKKVDANGKQPPDMSGESNRHKTQPKNEVNEMSDEEFAALPEAAKRRLRGDFI